MYTILLQGKFCELLNNLLRNSLVIGFFLLVKPTFSQDFYVMAGLNACNITGTGFYTFQKPGAFFSLGRVNEIEQFKEGRFYYGLGFSQEGARKVPNLTTNDLVAYNIRLNYVEAPLWLELKMKSAKALLGMSPSFLVSTKEKDLNGISILQNNAYRKLEVSVMAGFAISAGDNLNFSIRASNSLFPIVDIAASTLNFGRGPRNLLFTMGVTYIFKKKKKAENEDSEDPEG